MTTEQTKSRKPATIQDEQALYHVPPSFVDLLPWVEFLPDSQCLLLDDGRSVAAVIELQPLGTEGREAAWLQTARDAVENALQDSFDEFDHDPWVLQLYVQDETDWDSYLSELDKHIHARARGTAFTNLYLQLIAHHLHAVSKPGGLFHDHAVTRLPWRGQTRRVRLVVYRRLHDTQARRELRPEDALITACDRLTRGLANAGIVTHRLDGHAIRAWLLRWFNPSPAMLGTSPEERRRFYAAASSIDDERDKDDLPLASGTDFAQNLFYSQPRSDARGGVWYFDGLPHRVLLVDRLRKPPTIGHLTGETRNSGDAINAAFDHLPEGSILSITMVATPQDTLEGHLNYLSKKSIGETLDSEQTRHDVQQARSLIGSQHKLYRGSIALYLRARDLQELERGTRQAANVLLSVGLQPVREDDEVAALNSYLRSLPCCYDPASDRRHWYAQLMFAQHIAHLAPVWGRSRGTGHPGLTFFNRGGAAITFDPLSQLDRQMNAHLFLFGPTGSGKSATLNSMLHQVTAIYRPRLFIVEAGNSFGLFAQFAERLGLTVNRVKLAPNSGISLAPFADAVRLVLTPAQVQTLDADALDEPANGDANAEDTQQQRDVLGELEITARLMITGGEPREEARMTRADRSLLRQCILDAAHACVDANAPVLPESVRDALRRRAGDTTLPESRRTRLLEMADALDMFCQGVNAQLFNRAGSAWPEADVTIVDLATFAREGYSGEMAVAYVSLVNAVNNIAERDQFLGRPIIFATDEGHIITRNPLTAPFVVKATKMWRKLMTWFWLATPSLDDFPPEAHAMLNMIEWWICLNMPPDEVAKIARFRELTPSQKQLILSARKEFGKFTEGVILSKSMEVLFRAVLPSVHLSIAMSEGEEKHQRYELMKEHGIEELDAALMMAAQIDRERGIEPLSFDLAA